MSSSSQSASPPVLSPSRISLFLPPKTTFNVPNTQVSLLVAECNSVRAAVATPRKTPPAARPRTHPHQPSPDSEPGSARHRGARRPPAARHWSRGRACHILFSGSCSGARTTRSHTHTDALWSGNPGPGAQGACRGTWGLQTPRAQLRSSCLCPPAPPPSSLLAPPREPAAIRVGVPSGLRDHLSRARAARHPAAAAGAAGGAASGWIGDTVGSAPRASLFAVARRRRERREGPRPRAARLGGGSWPPLKACTAPHPRAPRAPSAYSWPPLPPPLPPTSPTRPGLT